MFSNKTLQRNYIYVSEKASNPQKQEWPLYSAKRQNQEPFVAVGPEKVIEERERILRFDQPTILTISYVYH